MIFESFRKLFGQSSNDITKKLFESSVKKYDGIYFGKVLDVDDKYGRIKVATAGVHDGFQTKDIPWAYPESSFIGSKKGSYIVPPVGSLVNIRFQKGDIHLPIYLSSKPHTKDSIPKGSSSSVDPKNIIFFETDDGDFFEIKTSDKEMKLKHSSGASLYISKDGKLHFHGTGIVDEGVSIATPNPLGGPFNCLITDPYTGMTHVGNSATASIPPL